MIGPITRRTFMRTSAATVAGVSIAGSLTSSLWAEPLVSYPGIQLYTVDKELKADVNGTLKIIRSIGYKEVRAQALRDYLQNGFEQTWMMRASNVTAPISSISARAIHPLSSSKHILSESNMWSARSSDDTATCEHGHIDPNRAMKSWRTAWRKMTQLIQCPTCREAQNPAVACRNQQCGASLKGVKSPLAGLRFHDLRHHAVTELAESLASDSTIMALAGHVSRRMLEHYSHVRQEAKREAVNVLSAKVSQRPTLKGYDTNNDTKAIPQGEVPSYVIENMVGTSGFEPLTSTVSR
jgi:Phage integrase family